MNILDLEFVKGFIRVCEDGWNQGWHERNGGNLTYRMRKEEVEAAKAAFTFDKPWVNMGVSAPALGGEYFLATGSGKFFRNVVLAPQDIALTKISAAFSIVCIRPKVMSKSGPDANRPWCAQTAASYSRMSLLVASAMSAPPGTIHSTTPTPPGKTTGHSVALFHSARENSRAVSGSTNVIAMMFAGCAW